MHNSPYNTYQSKGGNEMSDKIDQALADAAAAIRAGQTIRVA